MTLDAALRTPDIFTAAPETPRGRLVIIGGGARPDALMKRIVDLAGGTGARIVIIPVASDFPLEVAVEQQRHFRAIGALEVDIIDCTRSTADAPVHLALLSQATGVFFSGGDQTKLASILQGTRLLEAISGLYARGGVVAGTSAGAAVMSQVMITGDGPDGRTYTGEGFGFVRTAIIDQHFMQRQRYARLLSVVLEHSPRMGIGIDESTAVVVHPDRSCEVVGEQEVRLFMPAMWGGRPGVPAASETAVQVLRSGARFLLPPDPATDPAHGNPVARASAAWAPGIDCRNDWRGVPEV